MSHSSMLKARRKYQKIKKTIEGAEKKEKRAAELALKGPAPKKEKKVRVKKEKVPTEKAAKAPKPDPTAPKQEAKKPAAGAGGKKK